MAAFVLLFRLFIRRPAAAALKDPPGARSVVVFSGNDPELFEADRSDELYVGVRLLDMLTAGLAGGCVSIDNRDTLQNAQRATCTLGAERFALVLEWIRRRWVLSVEWVPDSAAERRHLELTHEAFSPADSAELHRLLSLLNDWLHAHPKLSDIRWYRKEEWLAEDTSDPGDGPLETGATASPAT
jgi:hypothetical protein